MTNISFQILVSLAVLVLVTIVPTHLQAQRTPSCDVDLSQASAWMTQAQAKASSGDVSGAMAILDQVEQALSDIKVRCGEAPVNKDLSQKFSEPGGLYTINYPKGWQNFSLPGNSNAQWPGCL